MSVQPHAELEDADIAAVGRDLVVTEDDLPETRDVAASHSLEDAYIENGSMIKGPGKLPALIEVMKPQIALTTTNSPHSLVGNHDDASLSIYHPHIVHEFLLRYPPRLYQRLPLCPSAGNI
ncbi:hypothetical protein TrVFT333_001809 [Trichoderma virens FT-333]|nr:hypothetical protein TrVFT333_001809 [Trichoderma virens FT-333]